jgi:hypothetical protein
MAYLAFFAFIFALLGLGLLASSLAYRRVHAMRARKIRVPEPEFIEPPRLAFLLGTPIIWIAALLTLVGAGGGTAAYQFGHGTTPFSIFTKTEITISGKVTLSPSTGMVDLTPDPHQAISDVVILTRYDSTASAYQYFDGQDNTSWTVTGELKPFEGHEYFDVDLATPKREAR